MPSFGAKSLKARAELHPILQKIVDEVIKEFDISILDATRGRAEQEFAFKKGNSKVHFGDSAHNWVPAVAMDIVPYPIDFDNIERFKAMAAVVLRVAKKQGVKLRWLGDPNGDGNTSDGWDFPHFELHPWREQAKKLGCKLYEGK